MRRHRAARRSFARTCRWPSWDNTAGSCARSPGVRARSSPSHRITISPRGKSSGACWQSGNPAKKTRVEDVRKRPSRSIRRVKGVRCRHWEVEYLTLPIRAWRHSATAVPAPARITVIDIQPMARALAVLRFSDYVLVVVCGLGVLNILPTLLGAIVGALWGEAAV